MIIAGPAHRLNFIAIVLLASLVYSVGTFASQNPDSSSKLASDAYEAGMRLLRTKQYAEALEQFRLEEKYAPNLPQGATGAGIALALLGRLGESEDSLHKALQIDRSDWMARRELGIVEWQLKQKDDAARDLQEIVKLFPTDQPVIVILGQYELERKNYPQAAAYFAAAPTELARNPQVQLMSAEALLKTGRLDDAKERLATVSARGDLTPEDRFRLGWLLGQSKQYPEAIRVFNSLNGEYPDKLKLSYGLALAYLETGDDGKCIETLKPYSVPPNTSPEILSLVGVAEEKSGRTQEAYNAFRQGIQLFPTDDESYLDIATLAAVHVNYDLALPAVSEGIEKIPNDYKLLFSRGLLYSLKGQHAAARADYGKALALSPDQAGIYVAIGMCDEDENKYGDAVAILQQALQRDIKDVLVYYFLADALFRQGLAPDSPQYQQARSAVESALALDPGYAFAYLQRAKLELMSGLTQDAIADLEHARTLEPDSQPILYQLANAYRRAGKKAEADKLMATVVEANKKEHQDERVRALEGIIVDVSSRKGSQP
jgi:tetratricopeptide (TPR) repeat protein